MGSRGNLVIVEQGTSPLYLYTHWDGARMHLPLQAALKRVPGRWRDTSYLARAIFCQMVEGQEMEETGFGISTSPQDNNYPYLIVDIDRQTVERRDVALGDRELRGPTLQSWSFQEFVDASL